MAVHVYILYLLKLPPSTSLQTRTQERLLSQFPHKHMSIFVQYKKAQATKEPANITVFECYKKKDKKLLEGNIFVWINRIKRDACK